jgi:hypothetical protein
LFGNLLGVFPLFFTFTSHIAVTLALTVFVVGLVTVVAIRIHGWHFFSYFVPQGVPVALLPLLVPIEILSYLSRLISLSVRLFANMMAGHVMLEVFGAFVVMLGSAGIICIHRRFSGRCGRRCCAPESASGRRVILCVTRLRPICWRRVTTFARCRSCWGITTCARP